MAKLGCVVTLALAAAGALGGYELAGESSGLAQFAGAAIGFCAGGIVGGIGGAVLDHVVGIGANVIDNIAHAPKPKNQLTSTEWQENENYRRIDKNLQSILSEEHYQGMKYAKDLGYLMQINGIQVYLKSVNDQYFAIDSVKDMEAPHPFDSKRRRAAVRIASRLNLKLTRYGTQHKTSFRAYLHDGAAEEVAVWTAAVYLAEQIYTDYLAGTRKARVVGKDIDSINTLMHNIINSL